MSERCGHCNRILRDAINKEKGSGPVCWTKVIGKKRDGSRVIIPVIYWENSGETCGNNLIKGRRVLTEGRLQIRDTEKMDKKRRSDDVVRLELRFSEEEIPF
jgi:single-stranded DNA-binding protein